MGRARSCQSSPTYFASQPSLLKPTDHGLGAHVASRPSRPKDFSALAPPSDPPFLPSTKQLKSHSDLGHLL